MNIYCRKRYKNISYVLGVTNFFEGYLEIREIEKQFTLMHEPAQKCKNDAIFIQKYATKMLIALK